MTTEMLARPQPLAPPTRRAAPTFVFADLVGYTALTEARGDEAAATVASGFHRVMRTLSRDHGAWQVKSMGDGVMIWAPDADSAVVLAAKAVAHVGTRRDLLPVRVGVHTGEAVMRGGDWFGRAVNIAARLAQHAQPNEALLSADTHAAARNELTRRLAVRSELELAGVDGRISVWRLS